MTGNARAARAGGTVDDAVDEPVGGRGARRVAGVSGMASGVLGIVANLALIGYFALATPWIPAAPGPWEWLGPANDVLGSASTAVMIPFVVLLGLARPDRPLRLLTGCVALALAALSLAGPALVAGVITLETQFVVTGVAMPVVLGWLLRVNGRGRGPGVPTSRPARFGRLVGAGGLVATAISVAALLLPAESTAQYVALVAAAIPGLPAYLSVPIWSVWVGVELWRRRPGPQPPEGWSTSVRRTGRPDRAARPAR